METFQREELNESSSLNFHFSVLFAGTCPPEWKSIIRFKYLSISNSRQCNQLAFSIHLNHRSGYRVRIWECWNKWNGSTRRNKQTYKYFSRKLVDDENRAVELHDREIVIFLFDSLSVYRILSFRSSMICNWHKLQIMIDSVTSRPIKIIRQWPC